MCLKPDAGLVGVLTELSDLAGVVGTCKPMCGRGGVGGRAMNLAPSPETGSSSSSSSSSSIFALSSSLAGVGGAARLCRAGTWLRTGVDGAAAVRIVRTGRPRGSPARAKPSTFIRFKSNPSFSLPLLFKPPNPPPAVLVCTFILLPKTFLPGLPVSPKVFKDLFLPDRARWASLPDLWFSGSASTDDKRVIDRVVRAARGIWDL